MSLFELEPDTAAKAADRSKRRIITAFSSYVSSYKRERLAFWADPVFTPIQMAEAWGVECLSLFTRSEETRLYINSVDPNVLTTEEQSIPAGWSAVPELENGVPTGRMIITQV